MAKMMEEIAAQANRICFSGIATFFSPLLKQ
jgi:hypothetical protein